MRSLRLAGADAVLLPTYTPIRVDEENQSSDRVFLGGLNVYLDSSIPGWSRLPSSLKRWLDHPAVIRQLSRFSGSTDASKLGPLTIDMLKGIHGPQRTSITELIDYLATPGQSDIIVFSNALISGIIPELRRQFQGTLITILQGDDVFLDDLPLNYRTEAIRLIRENLAACDGLLAHSDYYANTMSDYLGVQRSLIQKIPLTIDQAPEFPHKAADDDNSVTLGYFARLCPEKGVDRFLQAASRVISSLTLKKQRVRMLVGGFLPERHRSWFEQHLKRAQETAGTDRVEWRGSPAEREEKFRLLAELDLLCVPARYREPKGLYVLEAALTGVPCLLPDHGAFPELVKSLGSGSLFQAGSDSDLEHQLRLAVNELLTVKDVPTDKASRTDDSTEVQGKEAVHTAGSLTPGMQTFISRHSDRLQLRKAAMKTHGMSTTGPEILRVFERIQKNSDLFHGSQNISRTKSGNSGLIKSDP